MCDVIKRSLHPIFGLQMHGSVEILDQEEDFYFILRGTDLYFAMSSQLHSGLFCFNIWHEIVPSQALTSVELQRKV